MLIIDVLLLLLPLTTMSQGDTPLAFNAVTGITVVGFQISYAIPVLQRAMLGSDFQQGAISLGRWGTPMAWVAGIFLTFTSCIFFWPTTGPVEAIDQLNMNWVCVVVGLTGVLAALYWLAHGHRVYKGPQRAANAYSKRVDVAAAAAAVAPSGDADPIVA